METTLFFWLGFSLLLAHEMDAVRLHEWRILPLLSRLDDQMGYAVFTLAHIPLYAGLFWALSAGPPANQSLQTGLDTFFIIHVGLHVWLRNVPRNEFKSQLSWAIIGGAGLAGAVDLLLKANG